MKTLMIALLLLVGSSAFAQINYVRNPDFETHTFCPTNNDQIRAATHWSGVDTFHKVSCIPDYCHPCATGTSYFNSVPSGLLYWQYPHSGNGMAQVWMFYDESEPSSIFRDYLQGRLYKKLSAGKRYCVSFYVCLAEGSNYAVKNIEAYLDNGIIDTTKTCSKPQTQFSPQVSNQTGIITDTMHWTKIEGSFVANGTESFITIGNFKSKASTTYINIPLNGYNSHGLRPSSYYLIDDVSVIESDLKADAGPDKHVGKGDSVYIGRPKEVGLECTWSVLGSTAVIGTGAGIWVKPAATTNYVVTQTLCGAVTKDTVRVEVWAAGINGTYRGNQQYSIAPNPNNGVFELMQSLYVDGKASIKVRNIIGQQVCVFNARFMNGRTTLRMPEALPAGLYFLAITDRQGGVYTLRFEML